MDLIPANRIFHHVTAKPIGLRELLKTHFTLHETRIDELLGLGCIYLNKERVFEEKQLPKGVYLRLHLFPKRAPVSSIDWKNRVVTETPDFLVMDKPHGIPTHATVDNALENCLAQMRLSLGKELYVTQRLDTPVGGLLLFAKTKAFQSGFNQWLANRKIQKKYAALVSHPCSLGSYCNYMEPSERSPKKMSIESRPGWLPCELSIETCSEVQLAGKNIYQLTLELHTGRTHQIRAQLSLLGSPIIGDKLYGSRMKSFSPQEISLKAVELRLPSGYKACLNMPYFKEPSPHP